MAGISLKIKVISIVLITMIVAMGLIAWQNLQTQKAMLSQAAIEYTGVLAETIHHGFITAMARGENSDVHEIMDIINHSDTIKSIRIFDDSGRIRLSANDEEIGDFISTSSLHSLKKSGTLESRLHEDTGVFCTMVQIRNSPTCHQCHDADKAVLGILNVHTTLDHLKKLELEGRQTTIFTSAAALLFTICIIGLFFIVFVETPIRRMVRAMTRVEEGEFEASVTHLDNSTEMSLLSSKFNGMVSRLQELINTQLTQEKEIAIQEEKLGHHEEIRQMNTALAERLQEIEYLNVSLEERIEEIEEANYKIADLASELESKNDRLRSAVDRLSALNEMGMALNSTMEPRQIFDLLLQKTAATLGAKIGYLLLYDEGSDHFTIGAIHGVSSQFSQYDRIPVVEGGVSKHVIDNGAPLLIEDVRKLDHFSNIGFLGFYRETIICAPLLIKGEIRGTLTVANKNDATPFTKEDLEMLSTIAAQASIAINNANLYEDQESTYLATVQALISAIEASDAYTRGHSERVRHYSMVLGARFGLDTVAGRHLEQAAILHDIGKIGIDLGLLHKEGKLSYGEIDQLQQHPHIGNKILEPIHFLKKVRTIIAQHHERVDGKGYPAALPGEDIMLEAKILAVADSFDAMTSDRPYRKALSQEVAIQELVDCSGTQFDPEIAAVFVDLLRKGELDPLKRMT